MENQAATSRPRRGKTDIAVGNAHRERSVSNNSFGLKILIFNWSGLQIRSNRIPLRKPEKQLPPVIPIPLLYFGVSEEKKVERSPLITFIRSLRNNLFIRIANPYIQLERIANPLQQKTNKLQICTNRINENSLLREQNDRHNDSHSPQFGD